MFKPFPHIAAYLLLMLIPLQSIAADDMMICNSNNMSMLKVKNVSEQPDNMPCLTHMAKLVKVSIGDSNRAHTDTSHESDSKTSSATFCYGMCAMTVLPSEIKSQSLLTPTQIFSLAYQAYTSVTLPNLQRHPYSFLRLSPVMPIAFKLA